MDPLADKILVYSAFCLMVDDNTIAGWMLIVILAREFAVTGLRLLAANNNCVIAASKLGKSKTVSQMLMIILLIINCYPLSLIGGNIKDIVTVVLESINAPRSIYSTLFGITMDFKASHSLNIPFEIYGIPFDKVTLFNAQHSTNIESPNSSTFAKITAFSI